MFSGQYETDEDPRYYPKMLQINVVQVYSSQYLKKIFFQVNKRKRLGNVERYVSERTVKASRYKIWPRNRDHT